jgi:hypothetical protein
VQFCIGHWHQRAPAQFADVAQLRIVVTQQFADPRARARPDPGPQGHEGIDRGLREYVPGRREIDQSFEHRKIENLIADRHPDARYRRGRCRKHAIGEVLDGKIRGGVD